MTLILYNDEKDEFILFEIGLQINPTESYTSILYKTSETKISLNRAIHREFINDSPQFSMGYASLTYWLNSGWEVIGEI